MGRGKKKVEELNGYVRNINQFIPEAMEAAERKVKLLGGVRYTFRPGKDGMKYRHDYITQYFHREMNRITKEAGLRV